MTLFGLVKFIFGNVLLGLTRYLLELFRTKKAIERDLDGLKVELERFKKENARLNDVNAALNKKNIMLQSEIRRVSGPPPQATMADAVLFGILLAISVIVFVVPSKDDTFLEMANPFLYIILGALGYWYSLTIPFRENRR